MSENEPGPGSDYETPWYRRQDTTPVSHDKLPGDLEPGHVVELAIDSGIRDPKTGEPVFISGGYRMILANNGIVYPKDKDGQEREGAVPVHTYTAVKVEKDDNGEWRAIGMYSSLSSDTVDIVTGSAIQLPPEDY